MTYRKKFSSIAIAAGVGIGLLALMYRETPDATPPVPKKKKSANHEKPVNREPIGTPSPLTPEEARRSYPKRMVKNPPTEREQIALWVGRITSKMVEGGLPFLTNQLVLRMEAEAHPQDLDLPDVTWQELYRRRAGNGSPLDQTYRLAFDPQRVLLAELLLRLANDPRVAWAEPVYNQVSRFTLPDDPYVKSAGSWDQDHADQWGFHKLQVPDAWRRTQGSEKISIAVIDTGIDFDHPDLQGRAWINPGEIPGNGIDDDDNGYVDDVHGWNFADNDADVDDIHGHGTMCAGIIGARANNGIGMAGINQRSVLMAIRILGRTSEDRTLEEALDRINATTTILAEAIRYAADMGAKLVNNSWGMPFPSKLVEEALEHAHAKKSAMIFASGNASIDSHLFHPQGHWSVIMVNASTQTDKPALFTNHGMATDVIAPGGGDAGGPDEENPMDRVQNILSTIPIGSHIETEHPETLVAPGYSRQAGTSFAGPHAVGVASLITSRYPDISVEELRTVLRRSSDDTGPEGFDLDHGYGRVNASRASRDFNTGLGARILSPSSGNSASPGDVLQIKGIVQARYLRDYRVSYGKGQLPTDWVPLASGKTTHPAAEVLASWDTVDLPQGDYTVRLQVADLYGQNTEHRLLVHIAPALRKGFPILKAGEIVPVTNAPVMIDLNGDGRQEIVFVSFFTDFSKGLSNNYVHAITGNGNELAGFPVEIPNLGRTYSGTPAIGDIDPGSPGLEIVFTATEMGSEKVDSSLVVIRADGTFSIPVTTLPENRWDGEGGKQIVLFEWNGEPGKEIGVMTAHHVRIYDHRGALLAKIRCNGLDTLVGDITGDGREEVIRTRRTGFWVIRRTDNGVKVQSVWPNYSNTNGYPRATCLADIDEDDALEIVQLKGRRSGPVWVLAWNQDGSLVPGWPRKFDTPALNLILADVTGDMKFEIILTGIKEFAIFDMDGRPLHPSQPLGLYVKSSIVGDVTGDGIPELLISGELPGSLAHKTIAWDVAHMKMANGWPWYEKNALPTVMWGYMGEGTATFADITGFFNFDGGLQIESKLRAFVTAGRGLSVWNTRGGSALRDYSIPMMRGDANHDRKRDWADAIYMLDYLFLGGPSPAQFKEADANADGRFDMNDAIEVLYGVTNRTAPKR